MTIILCITTTANTFHSKTILELRTLIDQNSDDQSLHLLFFFFHYSLQSLFYISALHQIRTSITSIPNVLPIHLFRQVSLRSLLSLLAAWLQSNSKRCFYLRRAQFQSMIQNFFILIFQRVRFLENLENCSCFVQLMTFDLISLQLWLLRLRAFKQNSDYHNQYFALLLET